MQSYDKGDVLRVIGTFTDIDEETMDPSAVAFSFRTPAGSNTTYTYPADSEVVRTAQGVYYADLPFTESGIWAVRFFSTGNGQASAEREYFVKTSAF